MAQQRLPGQQLSRILILIISIVFTYLLDTIVSFEKIQFILN